MTDLAPTVRFLFLAQVIPKGLPISRSTGLFIAAGLAAAVTFVVAWPVVLSMSQLIYGHQIIGRHPDVHAVIVAFGSSATSSLFSQPLTTVPGWVLGRFVNPVAALNLLVLLTFPLTAIATYALARYLHGSHAAALIASLVFTFSPAHLAQAAYHPYTAQIQWIPLYFLALIALVDKASLSRVLALVLAGAGLALSNYDAALICGLLSPVVVVAFWAIRPDANRNFMPLIWLAALMIVAIAALALTLVIHPELVSRESAGGIPIEQIALYRARWWAYFTPSVDHPVLGGMATKIFGRQGINIELLEEQLFVGYGFLALALAAVGIAAWTWRAEWRYVVAIAGVGLAAALVSVGPTSGSCLPFSVAPGCLVFHISPFFRAYARFGFVVHLAVALAAGAGAVMLARHSRTGRFAAMALLVLGVFEYWPLPARAHDVLPTAGHRWLATGATDGRSLDCYPANQDDRFVPWLMKRQLSFLDVTIPTCGDPELGAKLAALGFEHVIVRGGRASSKLLVPLPTGIALARSFPDSNVYSIAKTLPPIVTVSATGFFDYEHQDDDWWRWMSPQGQWTVRNTMPSDHRIALSVDLVPIGVARTLAVTLDGAPVAQLSLGMTRTQHTLGPWSLTPGDHVLRFTADGEPTRPSDVADTRDTRPLTVAFRNERWIEPQ